MTLVKVEVTTDVANSAAPVISIGMPVYNGERFLAQAIESILAQSFSDFELIISDNASQDGTADICTDYCRRDARLRYVRQKVNIGAPANFNFVFRASRGKYFKWASANDLVAPQLLERCYRVLETRSDVVLCVGGTTYIDDCGDVIGRYPQVTAIEDERPQERFLKALQLYQNNAHAGLFRSSVLATTGLEPKYPLGDMVFLAELAVRGKFVELPEDLFFRRVSESTACIGKDVRQLLAAYYPAAIPIFDFSHWRKWCGYLDVVVRAPIPWTGKVPLFSRIARRMYWDRRALGQAFVPLGWRSAASTRRPGLRAEHAGSA